MPPRYVKPYVKRQKNDAADAEAICEAVTRPTMRFVEIKTCEQQGTLVLHRVRLMLMRQRVQLSNAIRGHMAEYGLVAPVGRNGLQRLIAILGNPDDERVPEVARTSLAPLVCQFGLVNDQVPENDRRQRGHQRFRDFKGHCGIFILAESPPTYEGHPPTWRRRFADIGESLNWIVEKHYAEARQQQIKRRVEGMIRGVPLYKAEIGNPFRAAVCQFKQWL
jgi:hypothetical protein